MCRKDKNPVGNTESQAVKIQSSIKITKSSSKEHSQPHYNDRQFCTQNTARQNNTSENSK